MDARDVGLEFTPRCSATRQSGPFLHRRCGGSHNRAAARHEPFNVVFAAPAILPMALLQLAHNPKSIGGISDVGVISEASG
jgi:hypothetical protein